MSVLVVHLCKITDDPTHHFPWKWFIDEDTPVGHVTDEGLAASPEAAERMAQMKFENAIADLTTQGRTHTTRRVEINLDQIIEDADHSNYWESADVV